MTPEGRPKLKTQNQELKTAVVLRDVLRDGNGDLACADRYRYRIRYRYRRHQFRCGFSIAIPIAIPIATKWIGTEPMLREIFQHGRKMLIELLHRGDLNLFLG